MLKGTESMIGMPLCPFPSSVYDLGGELRVMHVPKPWKYALNFRLCEHNDDE
jgi:hypothetical protein